MLQATMKFVCGLTIWLLASQVLATGSNWVTHEQKPLLSAGIQAHSLFRRTSNGRTTKGSLGKPAERTNLESQRSPSPKRSSTKSPGASAGNVETRRPNQRKRARTDQPGRSGSPHGRSEHQSARTPSPHSRSHWSHSEMSDSETDTWSSSASPSMRMFSLSSDHNSRDNRSPEHPSRLARANIRLYGPGVTVVGGSKSYPEYSNIRNDETTSHQVTDPHRAKAAGTTYEHEGGAVASAKGNVVQATVDARKSKQGGRLSSSGRGRDPHEFEVSPGLIASLRHDYSQTGGQIVKIKGELYGKGLVKASSEYITPREPSS